MDRTQLIETAQAIVTDGKGILAEMRALHLSGNDLL